jgi:hypothetical protein
MQQARQVVVLAPWLAALCVGSTQAEADNVTSSVSPWQPVMFSLISPELDERI